MRYSVREEGKRTRARRTGGGRLGGKRRKSRMWREEGKAKKRHGKLKQVREDLRNAMTKNEKFNEIMNRRNIPVLSPPHQEHPSSTHKLTWRSLHTKRKINKTSCCEEKKKKSFSVYGD